MCRDSNAASQRKPSPSQDGLPMSCDQTLFDVRSGFTEASSKVCSLATDQQELPITPQ